MGTKEVETAVPLAYFWRNLDMPLINCNVSLTLTWSADCVITTMENREITPSQGNNPAVFYHSSTNVTFKITGTKLYVIVVTLPTEDENKLFEQLKLGLKRTIRWNKCRSEVSNQTKTNNLNYLIEPTFNKINRLFVLSIENEEDRTYFLKDYTPKVKTKDFNVLIDGKSFFDMSIKKQRRNIRKNY